MLFKTDADLLDRAAQRSAEPYPDNAPVAVRLPDQRA